jgi:hypothetical protein
VRRAVLQFDNPFEEGGVTKVEVVAPTAKTNVLTPRSHGNEDEDEEEEEEEEGPGSAEQQSEDEDNTAAQKDKKVNLNSNSHYNIIYDGFIYLIFN